jgi:hypothetical protein
MTRGAMFAGSRSIQAPEHLEAGAAVLLNAVLTLAS